LQPEFVVGIFAGTCIGEEPARMTKAAAIPDLDEAQQQCH
jgi:hypothetical protein